MTRNNIFREEWAKSGLIGGIIQELSFLLGYLTSIHSQLFQDIDKMISIDPSRNTGQGV